MRTELLDAVVAIVGDVHVAGFICRDAADPPELPRGAYFPAELPEVFAFGVELDYSIAARVRDPDVPAGIDGDRIWFLEPPCRFRRDEARQVAEATRPHGERQAPRGGLRFRGCCVGHLDG